MKKFDANQSIRQHFSSYSFFTSLNETWYTPLCLGWQETRHFFVRNTRNISYSLRGGIWFCEQTSGYLFSLISRDAQSELPFNSDFLLRLRLRLSDFSDSDSWLRRSYFFNFFQVRLNLPTPAPLPKRWYIYFIFHCMNIIKCVQNKSTNGKHYIILK